MVNFLNNNAGSLQSIFTLILVLVTLYYAVQTRKTVKAMEDSKKMEFIPILALVLRYPDSAGFDVATQNVGKGIAKNPIITFLNSKKSILSLNPGEDAYTRFDFPISEFQNLTARQKILVIEYEDVFNRTIRTSIDLFIEEAGTNSDYPYDRLQSGKWIVAMP